MSIKIILADDHKLLIEGLRTLLEQEPDMNVIAVADNGRMLLQLVRKMPPDVIIMDITMPDLNGIEATRKIVGKYSGTKVIALSIHAERQYVQEMLRAGASGYLLKDCAFKELINAIRMVNNNQIYLCEQMQVLVVKDYVRNVSKRTSLVFSHLTVREREVLQPLTEGQSAKQIARSLDISNKTVETYRKNIMDKLNIHSIAELTKFAVREGITSLDK